MRSTFVPSCETPSDPPGGDRGTCDDRRVTRLDDARAVLSELDDALAEAFGADHHGFPWYASIQDPKVQVVRSNQAIAVVDAAQAHLDALAEAARQLRKVVGPNGRTMPTPGDAVELAQHDQVWVEITDGLRAAGSLLDVLGGLTVLQLGLPVSPTFADSRHLLRCEPAPTAPAGEQAAAVERARLVVAEAAESGPAGWIAWTLESRNAMVHRGRNIAAWLPVPAPGPGRARLVVVTEMPPQRVVRVFPHVRRMPDLTDAETVLLGAQYPDTCLNEPAQDTLDGLVEHCAGLTAAVVENLHGGLADLSGFTWPQEWALADRPPRAIEADGFEGFDHRPVPGADFIAMNPRTAERLLAAERIRLAEQEEGTEAETEPGAASAETPPGPRLEG